MKKKILIYTATLVAAVVLACVFLFPKHDKGVTENEWLIHRKEDISNLEVLAENVEDVYTLYISGGMSAEQFVNERLLLVAQFNVCNKLYEDAKKDDKVIPGSASWISGEGVKSLENTFQYFGDLLNESVDGTGSPLSPEEMSYLYLSCKEKLTDSISAFTVACSWIEEAKAEEERVTGGSSFLSGKNSGKENSQ